MKMLMYELAEITRGMTIPPNERTKPKDMSEITEMYVLGYTDLLSYNEVPTLENTIDINSVEKDNKVYVNLKQKYKQGTVQKEDIILPISNVDFEPRLIRWKGNEKLDYIYHQKVIVVRPNTKIINPEYLFYILTTTPIREYFREHSKEGIRYRLVCKTVMDLKIEVPDMEEQIKIVERIKKHNLETMEIRKILTQLAEK